jgi:L-threonylcarbamoyladenylate synthase
VRRSDLERAAAVLRAGGIVAYPTEACYGLGCDPRRHDAVRRLLRIKRRPWDMGLILIADDLARLRPYLAPLSDDLRRRVSATWPGPVTWVLPARPSTSRWLRGRHDGLAVRVTAHPGAAALCRQARSALVSTSANRHGRTPALSAAAVRRELGHYVDFILPGQLGGLARPTEIRDGLTGRVLRSG